METLQLNLFEEWKPLPGNEKYLISTYGRCMTAGRMIQSKAGWQRYRKGRLLVKHDNGKGYFAYLIDGKHIYIHRLVALTFIPNPENKEQVDHIDGNKANNCVDNLRWATRSENLHNPVTYPRMSEVHLKRTVVMLDADGKYICEVKGVPVLSRMCGIPESGIKNCLSPKMKNVSCDGFQFLYKEDYDETKDYHLCLPQNMGHEFVINENALIVFSDGKVYDAFPSSMIAEKELKIHRHYISKIYTKHISVSEIYQRKLPPICDMYLYKDLEGVIKEEARLFYRKKYPIPKII